jgi:cell division septation protein DedD
VRAQAPAGSARTPEHVAPPSARAAVQSDTGAVIGWSVQLGSFASRENAERLVHELKARRFSAFVSESTGGGRKLYRVRVGPESDQAAAQALVTRLRSAGHAGGSIVPNP